MFQFEGYTLDISRNALRTAGREVALRRKSFELLRYLVENSDRLVTKEDLLKAIWPNVVVTDESLTNCVSEVRQAIGDSRQTIIVTLPGRGYRFAAPVLRVATGAGAAPPHLPQAGVIAYRAATHSPSPLVGEGRGIMARQCPIRGAPLPPRKGDPGRVGDRPSVAVLPFANLSGDPQQDYFSDGIADDVITELSRFSELRVIARNSSFQYKGKAVDIRQVGRELGALYVLEGSVKRSGDRVRITAQLIDAAAGTHRWAERYDRELHDVFAVQDEVARAIVATLAAHVKRAETERALLKPPAVWEAYEYYLRGAEAFLNYNRRTKASLYDARRMLERCLAIDPNYARAAAILSWTHFGAYFEPFDGDYLSPAALDRALELAEAAVHLDPLLPQARAQLGNVLLYKHRHDAAITEFERAFALNPNFIDHRYASAFIYAGEPARAIEVLEAGIRLDPFPWPPAFGQMGLANYLLKRYGEAVRLCGEYASRSPSLQTPHLYLASAYAQSGRPEEAKAEAAQVPADQPRFHN